VEVSALRMASTGRSTAELGTLNNTGNHVAVKCRARPLSAVFFRRTFSPEQPNCRSLIPADSIITVMGGPFNGARLVDIVWNGQSLLMFTDELRDHGRKLAA